MNRERAEMLTGREVRRFPVEIRSGVVDGVLTLDGYASLTDTPYEMGGYKETIKRGAFSNTLNQTPDVQLLINHEGLPLARTGRNMTLSEDDRGLRVEARLDITDPDVQRLAPKVTAGLIDQMSFAFRVVRQTWDENYDNRDIVEVNIHRGDVSVVNQGASPTTSFTLRDWVSALSEVRAGKALSTSTMSVLQNVLDLVSGADDGVDQAQIALSSLMGVPNPDDDTQWQQNAATVSDLAAEIVYDLDLFRARAYALRSRAS